MAKRLRRVISTCPSILELLFNGFVERIPPRKRGGWHTDEEWNDSFAEAQIKEFSSRGECIVREKYIEEKGVVKLDESTPSETPKQNKEKGDK